MAGATTAHGQHQDRSIQTPQQVGKYLVSPIVHVDAFGRVKASVSIRSGHGSMTHDRVLRLTPEFPNGDDAARYAVAEGIAWIEAANQAPFDPPALADAAAVADATP